MSYIIDLSYLAAKKLGIVNAGRGYVEVSAVKKINKKKIG